MEKINIPEWVKDSKKRRKELDSHLLRLYEYEEEARKLSLSKKLESLIGLTDRERWLVQICLALAMKAAVDAHIRSNEGGELADLSVGISVRPISTKAINEITVGPIFSLERITAEPIGEVKEDWNGNNCNWWQTVVAWLVIRWPLWLRF